MSLLRLFAAACLILLFAVAPSVKAQDGTLDSLFSPPVPAFLSVTQPDFRIRELLVSPAGVLVYHGLLDGSTGGQLPYVQLTTTGTTPGSVDPSFIGASGGDGSLERSPILIQPDGKILERRYRVFDGGFSMARSDEFGASDHTYGNAANNYGGVDEPTGSNDTTPVCAIWLGNGNTLVGNGDHLLWLDSTGAEFRRFEARNAFANNTSEGVQIQCVARDLAGGILVGACGTALFRDGYDYKIFRLKTDGTLDSNFNVAADNYIEDIVVQPDGKILVAGQFKNIAGAIFGRTGFARLNADGTIDANFHAANITIVDAAYHNPTNGTTSFYPQDCYVLRIALQTDGKIILFGSFTGVDFRERNNLVRILPTGEVDDSFVGGVDWGAGAVLGGQYNRVRLFGWRDAGLAIQGDGKVLVGGWFGSVNFATKLLVARLNNTIATHVLAVPNAATVTWTHAGGGPELLGVSFEQKSGADTSWHSLGEGTRDAQTSNWTLTGQNMPASGKIRARGRTHRGGLIEQEVDFALTNPTVVNAPTKQAVTVASATLGATVVSAGDFTISERGIVYSLSVFNSDPQLGKASVSNVAAPGTIGTFTVNVTGLSAGSSYTFRGYAKCTNGSVAYSPVDTFTTTQYSAPTVSAPTATSITSTTAWLGGTIVSPGSSAITDSGVVYSLTSVNSNPLPTSSNVQRVSGGTSGTFSAFVSSLSVGASYSYRAFALNAQGYGVSAVGTFTTLSTSAPPLIGSPIANSIGTTSAALGAYVQYSETAVTDRGLVYAPTTVNTNPVIGGSGVTKFASGSQTGTFSATVTGLSPNTSYTWKAYATSSGGTSYTSALTFTTRGSDPAGMLDLAFATNGTAIWDSGMADDGAKSIVVQPDGKVIVAGYRGESGVEYAIAILRYMEDGSLDSSFGVNGVVTTDLVSPNSDLAYSVALQPDGKILVGGRSANSSVVVRYLSNGALDSSFGSGGKVFGPNNPYDLSIALQVDGKIVLAVVDSNAFLLTRFTPSGALDNTFGSSGVVRTPQDSGNFVSVALQGDGKIVVAGVSVSASEDLWLARYNVNGTLDTSFGTGGITIVDFGAEERIGGIAIQPDGKIVVAGYWYNGDYGMLVARFTSSGSLDTSFASGGSVISVLTGQALLGYDVALQADGKIVVSGSIRQTKSSADFSDFAVVRYTTTGVLDTTFGSGGLASTNVESRNDVGRSIAIANGRIYVAGVAQGELNRTDFALVRYLGDAVPATVVAPTSRGITNATAVLGGSVTNDGGRPVIDRGVVYSVSSVNANPQIGGAGVNSVAAGGALGAFEVSVAGLAGRKDYTFKAYAITTAGISYSGATSFTTADTAPSAPDGTASGTTGDQQTMTVQFPRIDPDGDTVVIAGTTGGQGIIVNSFTDTSVTFTPAAGFIGAGAFTYSLSDGHGRTGVGTVTVYVTDNDAPSISSHVDIGPIEATSAAGANVFYEPGSASDNVTARPTLTYSKASGSNFAIGDSTVTVTATDASGNVGLASFKVKVVDTTGPVLTMPPAVYAKATSSLGANVSFNLRALDVVDGAVAVTSNPVSGSAFPVGTATVGVSATDSRGNVTNQSFTVTVGQWLPGALAFSAATENANPVDASGLPNTVSIPIERVGGAAGFVSVVVTPSELEKVPNGFAKYEYGKDYEFVSGGAPAGVVFFEDGQFSATVDVRLKAPALLKKGVFELTLGTPTGGVALGALTSATITINARDAVKPTVVISAPGATVATPGTFDLTGTVKDDAATDLSLFTVTLNGATVTTTRVAYVANTAVAFSANGLQAENGTNTLVVTARDAQGNTTVTTKTFTCAGGSLDPALAGTYTGLLVASGTPDNDSSGFFTATITGTGNFTGNVTLGGTTVPIKGLLNNEGVARFAANSYATVVELIDTKEFDADFGSLGFTIPPEGGEITATVNSQPTDGDTIAIAHATKNAFGATHLVATGNSDLLTVLSGTPKGVYNVSLPSEAQADLTSSQYPQGDGLGILTLSNTGVVSIKGNLADGTAYTASGNLKADLTAPLHVNLYKKGGALAGTFQFDPSATDSDISGSSFLWLRPALTRASAYKAGWPNGVTVSPVGTKFVAPTDSSVLPNLPAIDSILGNAALDFTAGLLSSEVSKSLNITQTAANTVTKLNGEASYTLTVVNGTGGFSGTFTHSPGKSVAYKGIILNKGANAGGFGYFLSPRPLGTTSSAQSGSVTLIAKP